MTLYNVHIYREMRVKFEGIEADTPGQAAAIAGRQTLEASDYEYSVEDYEGETFTVLVDVVGDEEYEHSEWIEFEAGVLQNHAAELLESLNYLLEQTVDMDLNSGIALSEGEEDARRRALAVIAKVRPRS